MWHNVNNKCLSYPRYIHPGNTHKSCHPTSATETLYEHHKTEKYKHLISYKTRVSITSIILRILLENTPALTYHGATGRFHSYAHPRKTGEGSLNPGRHRKNIRHPQRKRIGGGNSQRRTNWY